MDMDKRKDRDAAEEIKKLGAACCVVQNVDKGRLAIISSRCAAYECPSRSSFHSYTDMATIFQVERDERRPPTSGKHALSDISTSLNPLKIKIQSNRLIFFETNIF